MFEPWIGDDFGRPSNRLGGYRLLLLGESHYTHDPAWVGRADPNGTKDVIQSLAIDMRYIFFTKLSRLSTGQTRNQWIEAENANFWHSVAFYNFITVNLAYRGRPTNEQWVAGRAALPQKLREIQPDGVIVCGLGLWWWVMDSLPGGVNLHPPAQGFAQSGSTQFIRIPHPTGARGPSAYSYTASRPAVAAMLNQP